mgnify:FL=1
MAREVDDKKTRRAMNRVRRARRAAEQAIAASEDREAAEAARAELSEWEAEFLESLEERLDEYGSAFADPEKGDLDEPLSRLQVMKLKEIEKKARGKDKAKPRTGAALHYGSAKTRNAALRRRAPGRGPNVRDVNADMPADPVDPMTAPDPEPGPQPEPGQDPGDPPAPRPRGFTPRVIEGGKTGEEP